MYRSKMLLNKYLILINRKMATVAVNKPNVVDTKKGGWKDPVKVSPLIRLSRWVALGLGIFYGISKQELYKTLGNRHEKHEQEIEEVKHIKIEEEKLNYEGILEGYINPTQKEKPKRAYLDYDIMYENIVTKQK